MRMNLLVLLSMFFFALAPVFAGDPPVPPHSFSFRHFRASGHGCAVNGVTITNRHMVDPRRPGDFSPPHKIRFRYEFPDGTVGIGYSKKLANAADIAIVVLDKEPASYAILGDKPELGDHLTWVEYDFRKRANVFQPRVRRGKVVTIMSGHIYLDQDVVNGASGGCMYSEDGKVVGIITAKKRTNDRKWSAVATALYGDWWKDIVPD